MTISDEKLKRFIIFKLLINGCQLPYQYLHTCELGELNAIYWITNPFEERETLPCTDPLESLEKRAQRIRQVRKDYWLDAYDEFCRAGDPDTY